MSELAQFEALLKQAMGLNAKSVGLAMIERAVRERCAVNGVLDIAAYWRQVKESPAELQELIELVVVPETWFFRNGEAFKALAQLAVSHTLRLDRRLRILSLPCSTGEEPYSMAMALLDAGVSPTRFHIDALDISACCIAMAQRATYGMNSFRGKDLEFRDRHFVAVGERYALAETVRSNVRFRQGNLFEPALLADVSGYDFIFCRNVLIYFGDAEQARAVSVLDRLLSETGMLFVGPSEGGVLFREKMVSANLPLAFAFRKTAPAPASQTNSALSVSRSAESKPDTPARARSAWTPRPGALPARPVYGQAQGQASLAPRRWDVVPASAAVSRDGSDNDPIAVAARLADQGRLREAAEICKRHVQDHGPDAAAFYLLGLVSDAAGHHREAREHYRKTLYLDPDHTGSDAELASDAMTQSRVTHGHLRSQVCCALYCLWARRILQGAADAWTEALQTFHALYPEGSEARTELETHVLPPGWESIRGTGTGYVVDCLRSARQCVSEGDTYEQVVKAAVRMGRDTDTTAAVAGGIAGLIHGVEGIPTRWREALRGQALLHPMLQKLLRCAVSCD